MGAEQKRCLRLVKADWHAADHTNGVSFRSNAVRLNETAIEIRETEETLDLLDGFGRVPCGNRSNFGGIHLNTIGGDNIAEKINFSEVKRTFLWVDN